MDELKKLFERRFGTAATLAKELGPSGSNRRYFRLQGGNISVIGVIGTNASENKAFISLAAHLRGKGINVPEVYAVDEDGLRYIQEDLGDLSLFQAVSKGRESGHYSPEEEELLCKAVGKLPKIQFEAAEGLDWSVCHPESEFNGRMVLFDLNYFKYCFLKATGIDFDEVALQEDFEALRDDLLQDPGETFMYRDFQARNVMLKDGEPYFIDFQGGRRGPVYYDLASFIHQARARYPEPLRRRMVDSYLEALGQYGKVDRLVFEEKLRLFSLFRTLQVLGAYGFRGLFERKSHFLASIPCALANLRELLQRPFEAYPCLDGVLKEISKMPECSGKLSAPGTRSGGRLEIEVFSFSYKRGVPTDWSGNGGGYVFDCRSVNNPGRYEAYRNLTGLDKEVVKFLEDDGGIKLFLDSVFSLVDSHVRCFLDRGFTHLQVCFGCTGGRHRSVYSAESLAEHLAAEFDVRVLLRHRELGIQRDLLGRKAGGDL